MRLPSVAELERLMGFETGYTVPVMGSSAAKDQGELFAYSRKSLLGNSMSCWVCSYLLGCLAHHMGLLVRPPTRAEVRLAGDHHLRLLFVTEQHVVVVREGTTSAYYGTTSVCDGTYMHIYKGYTT